MVEPPEDKANYWPESGDYDSQSDAAESFKKARDEAMKREDRFTKINPPEFPTAAFQPRAAMEVVPQRNSRGLRFLAGAFWVICFLAGLVLAFGMYYFGLMNGRAGR